ncbi:FAD-binding protein [Pseudomonadota bacterium]
MSRRALSWGRYPRFEQTVHPAYWPKEVPGLLQDCAKVMNHSKQADAVGTLAFGMGRSYGDSCLAAGDEVIGTSGMDRLLAVDWDTGVISAQAGLTLDALIRLAIPRGWFLSVTPGTRFVTLGGALANDVHGKNHHVGGTFGAHVRRLTLYRSDEGVVTCSPRERPELFAATVGGLGLTGIMLSVEIQLRAVSSSQIDQRSFRFENLDEFFDLAREHDPTHEYTVAWIDCVASGERAGRGHYMAGDHAKDGPLKVSESGHLKIPFVPPVSLVNAMSLRWFNKLYYGRHPAGETKKRIEYAPFFYPLDGIAHWNRMYGKKGFQQYQCVVPRDGARYVIRSMLGQISKSGTGSFLAVLKQFGDKVSPGLLSFPMPGVTLALDFPQRAKINEQLFSRLNAIVHEAGGRLYPAKDAQMNAEHFKQAYPEWSQLEALRDPQILSRFWRRVTQ